MQLTKVVCLALCVALTGCGAILNGSSKMIDIQCSPSGTSISANPEIGDYTCPTTLKLQRKHSYVLTFSKEGYNSKKVEIRKGVQAGIIILDVLLTGLIGVIIDATTGSWNNLKPDQVSVSLEKIETGVVGPDKIEITMQSSEDDSNTFQIESSEPIKVSIEKID